MDENKPIVVYQKNADPHQGRIIIPKFFIENNGREFLMEVYKDKIVIKPLNEKEVK